MSRTDDERYAMHQRSECSRTWFHDGPCAPSALWAKGPMTDTTAPRTAAPDHRCGWCHQPFTGSFNAHRGNECPDMRDEIRPAFRRAIEAEAIEPLLALVRAAQDATDEGAFAGSRHIAINRLRTALAALPESVRVAARKPE